MALKDYYKILELSPSANQAEIKQAYRRLAKQFHPDKNQGDLYAAAQFEMIKEAYEVLSNPGRKDQYLQQRWYNQSIGKKRTEEIITPVTILQAALELDRYVSRLDIHRMDTTGLYDYICTILSDDAIERLNKFGEEDSNDTIAALMMKSGRTLPWKLAQELSNRIGRLSLSARTRQDLARYEHRAKQSALWDRYKAVILLLIVLTLCVVIYVISN
jgi:curved DNA-binding protein CbpA